MVNRRELLDRFGDTEFLTMLWRKAEVELPGRISEIGTILSSGPPYDDSLLSGKLHKLRGLVANFLTGNSAIPSLVTCEALVERKEFASLPAQWESFCEALEEETRGLNRWLAGSPEV